MPPPTAPASAGHPKDLSGAKVKRSKGSVAKSLSIEIARVVFARFSSNARVFLQECTCTQGFLAAGRTAGHRALARALCRVWAALGRNQFSFFVENRNSFSF